MADPSTWPVPLPQNEATKRQVRTYTDAEREAAYEVWSTVGLRQDKETGRLMEIPPTTIQSWRLVGDWESLVKRDDESAAASSRFVIRAMVAPLGAKAIRALDRVLDDPKANANAVVRAAELALAYNGTIAPKSPSATITQHQDGTASLAIKLDLSLFTASELASFRDTGAVPARFLPQGDTPPSPTSDEG